MRRNLQTTNVWSDHVMKNTGRTRRRSEDLTRIGVHKHSRTLEVAGGACILVSLPVGVESIRCVGGQRVRLEAGLAAHDGLTELGVHCAYVEQSRLKGLRAGISDSHTPLAAVDIRDMRAWWWCRIRRRT